MSAQEVAIEIDATPQEIFDFMHDYKRRTLWDPFLKEAHLLNGKRDPKLEASIFCKARSCLGGLSMETVYISFKPPHLAAVKMTRGPAILNRFAASIRHRQLSARRTRVSYRYNLSSRDGLLRPLWDSVLCWIFAHETRKRLLALKQALERSKKQDSSETWIKRMLFQ